MPLLYTDSLDVPSLSPVTKRQVYNGLDCCVTAEVLGVVKPYGSNESNVVYDFERALQAPVLEMMLRGFKVDQYERRKGIEELEKKIEFLDNYLQQMAEAVWGKGLNPNSPKQLIDFFYRAMRLPEQWKSDKGVKRISTDREALEKLELYFHARPIVATILEIRNYKKQLSVLQTEIDPDGRMRTSYNIAGTETGRWSSSANAFGTGTNLQNITAALRKIFIADAGYKLCGIDLEQAESREVGWLCGILFDDWSYLDACYSGDLHTLTCKLIWPDLPWPNTPKGDRELADQIFYRQYSRRDMSKRGGHGSNYYGTPHTMARHLKVPVKLMENFQTKYFSAFPGIPRWHRWTAEQLQRNQLLITPFGRRRHFFGRPNDDSTLREAIAFCPQSATGDRMNLGLYRIWQHMRGRGIQIIAQVHDAVYFQFPEHLNENEIVSEALSHIDIKMTHKDRTLIVPGEPKTGWNWGNYVGKEDVEKWEKKPNGPKPIYNPDGLKKLKGTDDRKRSSMALLERLM